MSKKESIGPRRVLEALAVDGDGKKQVGGNTAVPMGKNLLSRRGFLRTGAVLLTAASLPEKSFASIFETSPPERRLGFYNTHTGEQLSTSYWADSAYQPEGLMEIYHLLRDHRSGDVRPIDAGLLDLLYSLSASLGTNEHFHVISGYRSAATNDMLSKNGSGVAKRSLHMDGRAIDIFVPGRSLADVRRTAIALKGGGVGYYPASNFVHVDVGRVRAW